jgi:hypothetical protein
VADGQYVWELRVIPVIDAVTRRELAAARANGTDAATEAALRTAGRLPEPQAASGSFRVQGGAALVGGDDEGTEAVSGAARPGGLEPVTGSALEPVSDRTVISGDLTVYNALCVGFDCLSAETYGADSIRLKENTNRIHFDDTSTSAGFPNRDWRILANDQNSGGANKFSIEDSTGGLTPFTLTAGAATNSIFVDSSGRVGFRTATPVLDLHVRTGNTPALRLEQDASSGFTAQTWDIAGNEANFFVRDVTGGSLLPFRIFPGAASSSLIIAADEAIGIGTTSPSAPVHIVRNGSTVNAAFLLENTGGGNPRSWFFQNQSANGAVVVTPNITGGAAPLKAFPGAPENSIVIGQNGGGSSPRVGIHAISGLAHPLVVGTDATNGNGAHVTAAGVWTNGSSRVNKTGIVDLSVDDALATLTGLNPVRYKGVDSPDDEEYVGFIAEDVPALVAMNDRQGLAAMDIVAVLTKVVQQQQQVVEAQRAENAELAARLARVEALLGNAEPPAAP